MLVKKVLNFFVGLLGLCPIACTIPVLDTEFKKILRSPSAYIFKGKLWVMGNFEKTVSKTYIPRFFYSVDNWKNNYHTVQNDSVYSISDGKSIIKATLYAREFNSLSIDETFYIEGKLNTFDVIRKNQYYIEHVGKIYVVGGRLDNNLFYAADRNEKEEYDDVWFSGDGLNWQLATKKTPWSEKGDWYGLHRVAEANGYIYAARAIKSRQGLSIVWSSPDGISWEKIAEIANLKNVYDMFSFRNRLFLLGEFKDRNQALLYSGNGKDWIMPNSFPNIYSIKILSSSKKLYGFSPVVIYVSDDGITWTILSKSVKSSNNITGYKDMMAALVYEYTDHSKYSILYTKDGIEWRIEESNNRFLIAPENHEE